MSFISSTPQLPTYFDSEGNILASGLLYYYEQGANPNTPKTVYSDYTLTTPLDQPVPVGNDGRTGQQVFLGVGPYTVEQWKYNGATHVKDTEWDEDGLSSSATQTTSTNVATISALRVLDDPATVGSVDVLGYYASGDMFARGYVWDASDLNVDNGGTIIKKTGVATGSWIHDPGPIVDSRVFGLFPDGQGQANSILTSINGWIVGNSETTSSLALVSGTYSCVGDYTQSLDVFTDIEDGVKFNNTTAGTTYTLSMKAGYNIKLSGELESNTSTGNVVLDVSDSAVDGSGNARWWGASPDNTTAQNNSALSRADSNCKKIYVSEALDVSSYTGSVPLEVIGSGSITNSGACTFWTVSSVEGGLIGSGFASYFGYLRLSWFDSLSNAHNACSSWGNTLVWDGGALSLGAYTQAVSTPNRFEGNYNLTATGAVTLYQVQCPDFGKFAVSGGSFTFLETSEIKALSFDSLQEAINTAQNSSAVLDGRGKAFSGSTLAITSGVTLRDLNFTNPSVNNNAINIATGSIIVNIERCSLTTSGAGYSVHLTGDSVVNISGSALNGGYSLVNTSGKFKSSNCVYTSTAGIDVRNSSFNGDSFSDGILSIREGSRFNSCEFDVDLVRLANISTQIKNIKIAYSTINVSKASGVETGNIQFFTDTAGTKIVGVVLDELEFNGSADATYVTIQKNLSGSGSWSNTPSDHSYRSINHSTESSSIIAPLTKTAFSESIVGIDLSGNSYILNLSGDEYLVFTTNERLYWSVVAQWEGVPITLYPTSQYVDYSITGNNIISTAIYNAVWNSSTFLKVFISAERNY